MQKSVFIPYERYKDLLLRQSKVTQQQQSSNEVNQGGCFGSGGVGGGGGAAASFLPSAIHSFEAQQQQQTSTARLSTGRFSDASATDEASVVKLPAAPESSCSLSKQQQQQQQQYRPQHKVRLQKELVLCAFPKSKRKAAENLLDYINFSSSSSSSSSEGRHPTAHSTLLLDYNSKGELVCSDGTVIKDSSIGDLIKDATRVRSSIAAQPVGCERFYDELALDPNLPLVLIKNQKRHNQIKRLQRLQSRKRKKLATAAAAANISSVGNKEQQQQQQQQQQAREFINTRDFWTSNWKSWP